MDRLEAAGLEFILCRRCHRRRILRPVEDENNDLCSRCSELPGIVRLTIHTLIVGLRHYFEQFQDRQYLALRLMRERGNVHDPNATEVFASDESAPNEYVKIGYICREHAEVLARYCFPILGTMYECRLHLEIEAGSYEVPFTLTLDLLYPVATEVRHGIIDANGRAEITLV